VRGWQLVTRRAQSGGSRWIMPPSPAAASLARIVLLAPDELTRPQIAPRPVCAEPGGTPSPW
jgi:hypothetical protein